MPSVASICTLAGKIAKCGALRTSSGFSVAKVLSTNQQWIWWWSRRTSMTIFSQKRKLVGGGGRRKVVAGYYKDLMRTTKALFKPPDPWWTETLGWSWKEWRSRRAGARLESDWMKQGEGFTDHRPADHWALTTTLRARDGKVYLGVNQVRLKEIYSIKRIFNMPQDEGTCSPVQRAVQKGCDLCTKLNTSDSRK